MTPPDHHGLTEQQIRHLLAVAMSYDNRKPSAAAIISWGESARRNRWTFDEAEEAIRAHYDTTTDFAQPAHITQRIRAKRQDTAMRQPIAPPDPAGQTRVANAIAGAFHTLDDDDKPIAPWQRAVADAKQQTTQRRNRVLRYPDIAIKLTHPPLNLAQPSMWNGYIPPQTLPTEDGNPYASANRSPIRQQLLDIAEEAQQRETDGPA